MSAGECSLGLFRRMTFFECPLHEGRVVSPAVAVCSRFKLVNLDLGMESTSPQD